MSVQDVEQYCVSYDYEYLDNLYPFRDSILEYLVSNIKRDNVEGGGILAMLKLGTKDNKMTDYERYTMPNKEYFNRYLAYYIRDYLSNNQIKIVVNLFNVKYAREHARGNMILFFGTKGQKLDVPYKIREGCADFLFFQEEYTEEILRGYAENIAHFLNGKHFSEIEFWIDKKFLNRFYIYYIFQDVIISKNDIFINDNLFFLQ